jgi:hypothetical protein
VLTIAFGPDGQTSYLATLPSLDAGNALDLSQAIELPGNRRIVGIDGYPALWVADFNSPNIDRWDLREDGSLEHAGTVNFGNLGLTSAGQAEQGAFSLERGTFANIELGSLVNWNPLTMEIEGTLPLGIPDQGSLPAWIRNVKARPDGTLLASYYYIDADNNLGDGAGIVTVDWAANQIIDRDEWTGCSYTLNAGQTSNGATYFATHAAWVQEKLVYPPGSPGHAPACALRVLPGESKYDRSFTPTDLGRLINRQVTGTLNVSTEDAAFFVAWHDELVGQEITQGNFADLRFTTPAWKWYTWDLQSASARELPNAEPFAALPTVMSVEGKLYFGDTRLSAENGGLGVSQYYQLTSDGVVPAFVGYGRVYSILRLR